MKKMYTFNIGLILSIIIAEMAIIVTGSGGIPAIITLPISMLVAILNIFLYRSVEIRK